MRQTSGRTVGCPYHLCLAQVLVVGEGTVNERVRSHRYEGFVVCPGTGYVLVSPAAEQHRLMAERAVAAKLPRGVNG